MNIITFTWTAGTAHDSILKAFKKRIIKYNYDMYFRLCADLGEGFKPVDYFKISGNEYGCIYAPATVSEFFGIPSRELHGIEQQKIREAAPGSITPAGSLSEAVEILRDHPGGTILKTLSGKYVIF